MNICFYPAIFTKHLDDSYQVKFLDFECELSASSLEEAFQTAQVHLFEFLTNSDHRPTPTIPYSHISLEKNQFISLIEVDLFKCQQLSIKKTLTIPMWLNAVAEDRGINFSQLLQRALREELKIEK